LVRRKTSKKSLTPEQLFQCRVALALGIVPSEVEDIGSNDYDLLWLYWKKEPWGPYRDNLHTALIAREVRRGNFKGDHLLDQWMIATPEDQKAAEIERGKKTKQSVFGAFKAIAKRVAKKAK
jgi:hypothetical protein